MIPYSQHTNRKKDESFSQYKVINKKMTLVNEIICGVNYCKPPILYPTIQSENNIKTFTNGTVGKITTDPTLDLNDIINQIPPTVYIYISLLDKLGKTGSLTFDTVELFSQGHPSGTPSNIQVAIFKLEAGATKFDSSTYTGIGNSSKVVQSAEVPLSEDDTIVGGLYYNFPIAEQTLYAFDQTTGEQNYYFLGITGLVASAPIASTSHNESDSYNLIYYSSEPVAISDNMGAPDLTTPKPDGVPYYTLYQSNV